MNNEWIKVKGGSSFEDVMIDYFDKLFTASNTEWSTIIDAIQSKITEERNTNLLDDITEVEVTKDLFQMFLNKSAGPDGMSPRFY